MWPLNGDSHAPKRPTMIGIVSSVVFIKNHAIGMFWNAFLTRLCLRIKLMQWKRLQSSQSAQLNTKKYHERDKVKKKGMKRSTKLNENMLLEEMKMLKV